MTENDWMNLQIGDVVSYRPRWDVRNLNDGISVFILFPLYYKVGEICTEERYLKTWEEKGGFENLQRLIKFDMIDGPINAHTWDVDWVIWEKGEE